MRDGARVLGRLAAASTTAAAAAAAVTPADEGAIRKELHVHRDLRGALAVALGEHVRRRRALGREAAVPVRGARLLAGVGEDDLRRRVVELELVRDRDAVVEVDVPGA